jgi:putative NIF3 family GTP cyclohydrolase 1 type 2
MSLLRQVVASFKKFAPLKLADQSWDNVGVLVEGEHYSVYILK